MLPSTAAAPTADKIEMVSFLLQKRDKALKLFTPRAGVDNEMAMTYNRTIRNEKTLLCENGRASNANSLILQNPGH